MTHPPLALADIDIARLRLVKELVLWRDGEDHSRWIFEGPDRRDPVMIKLWNPGYLRAETLPRAVGEGFYDAATAPALRRLVFHRGRCRGYVMTRAVRCRRIDPEFVEGLWERTRTTGLFACQYRRSHTFRVGDRRSLIDLEGVYPLAALGLHPAGRIRIEDPHYAQLVGRLAEGPLGPEEVRRMAAVHVAAHTRGARAGWPGGWRGRAGGLGRGLVLRIRRLRPDARHLIEC